MAVGVSVPDAMGCSICEGGVRKPLGAVPLDDGCRERKLDELAFGERVLGVAEDPDALGSGFVNATGDPIVGEEGIDSLDLERVK